MSTITIPYVHYSHMYLIKFEHRRNRNSMVVGFNNYLYNQCL